jgi:glutathione S-transferase
MKIFDWSIAPNPRRLRIYLAEKGLKIPTEDVGGGGEDLKLKPSFIAKYPHAMVPMLELDDGTCVGEVMSIVHYIDTLHPDPPVLGVDAKDRAIVDMWERRANEEGMLAASESFRNSHPMFADRGLPGSAEPIRQLPELIERAKARLTRFFRKFDAQLANNEFVAGKRWSIADATTLCAVDFAKWTDCKIPSDCKHMQRWYEAVNARPSAKV